MNESENMLLTDYLRQTLQKEPPHSEKVTVTFKWEEARLLADIAQSNPSELCEFMREKIVYSEFAPDPQPLGVMLASIYWKIGSKLYEGNPVFEGDI